LHVNERAGGQFDASASRKAPLLEGLVIGDAAALRNSAVIGGSPPVGAFRAKDEAVGDIGVDADSAAPADPRLAGTFRVEAADADLTLCPKATKALSICLRGGAEPHDQCERRYNAGVQS